MEKRARISKDAAILALTLAAMIIADAVLFATGRHAADKEGIGVMVAAGVTIGMYSFLYKDNPIFKAVEHIYVGVSAGYILTLAWYNTFLPDVINPLVFPRMGEERDLVKLAPLTLGVLMLMRLSSKYGWYSRISFAFVIGFSSGIAIPNYIDTIIFRQLKYSVAPFAAASGFFDYFNAAVILVGTLSVLMYFWFSVERRGVLKPVSKTGVYFLMVCFGASFGYTIMARLSLLVERIAFLMSDWLKLI